RSLFSVLLELLLDVRERREAQVGRARVPAAVAGAGIEIVAAAWAEPAAVFLAERSQRELEQHLFLHDLVDGQRVGARRQEGEIELVGFELDVAVLDDSILVMGR